MNLPLCQERSTSIGLLFAMEGGTRARFDRPSLHPRAAAERLHTAEGYNRVVYVPTREDTATGGDCQQALAECRAQMPGWQSPGVMVDRP